MVGWYQQPVMMSTSSVVKAIAKYFGKQGAEEAAEYAAKKARRKWLNVSAKRHCGKEVFLNTFASFAVSLKYASPCAKGVHHSFCLQEIQTLNTYS